MKFIVLLEMPSGGFDRTIEFSKREKIKKHLDKFSVSKPKRNC